MLEVGLKHTKEILVTEEKTAGVVGSGSLPVFATPMLIALAEGCCCECLAEHLEEGMTTVGTQVNVAHTAATPVGMQVSCTCELTEVDGRRLVFALTMNDACGAIGHGTHERFIVAGERFLAKVNAKLQA